MAVSKFWWKYRNRLRRLRKENATLQDENKDLKFKSEMLLITNAELRKKLAHKPKSLETSLENINRELVSARMEKARADFDWDVGY